MGRYYRLTKKITEKMAEDILKEILGMEDVEKAEFAEENTKILVVTAKEKYPDVMTRIVKGARSFSMDFRCRKNRDNNCRIHDWKITDAAGRKKLLAFLFVIVYYIPIS